MNAELFAQAEAVFYDMLAKLKSNGCPAAVAAAVEGRWRHDYARTIRGGKARSRCFLLLPVIPAAYLSVISLAQLFVYRGCRAEVTFNPVYLENRLKRVDNCQEIYFLTNINLGRTLTVGATESAVRLFRRKHWPLTLTEALNLCMHFPELLNDGRSIVAGGTVHYGENPNRERVCRIRVHRRQPVVETVDELRPLSNALMPYIDLR